MAKYRQLHTSFWQDSFIMDLTPEDKYFFMYLLTNPKTTQCGIYELPYQMMQAETGYNRETVKKLIDRFQQYGKIVYSESTKEVCVVNWLRYNFINSKPVISCICSELRQVKDKKLIRYLKGMDTLCLPYGEEEEREEEREENNKPPISPLQGEGVCEEDDFDSELNNIFGPAFEQPTQKEKSCAKKEKAPRRTFQKPTAEEVKGYMVERGWKPDMASREGESFCNYYESNGWKVGRNKMSDWKATVRNWIARRENDSFGPVSIHKNPKAPQRSTEEQIDRVKTGALNAAALFMAKNNGTYGTE